MYSSIIFHFTMTILNETYRNSISLQLSHDISWKIQLNIILLVFQERHFASYLHPNKIRAVSRARNAECHSLSSSLCQQSSECPQ